MAIENAASRNATRKPRQAPAKPDIVIRTAEGSIIGEVKTIRGREATERVIGKLLGRGAAQRRTRRR